MPLVPALLVVLLAGTATAAVPLAALARAVARRWRRRPLALPSPARPAPAWQEDELAALLRPAAPPAALPAPRAAGDAAPVRAHP